jgi:radical SAM protein with 4Fe4S-binding SPASM domain
VAGLRITALSNTALNYTESWLRRSQPASYPVVLDIILTKACNLRCTFCISYDSLAHQYWLDYGLYQRIAQKLFPYSWDVQFCSGGEPFFYPQIREALALAAGYGCKTTVTTNGMLIDEKVADWLVADQSLHKIWLSFDAATKPTLERIRRGANFEKITSNVRELTRLRRARGRKWPKVAIRFVMMKSNAHELPALIEMARDIGAYHVEGRYLNVANDIDFDESLFGHPALAAEVFEKSMHAAKRCRIGLSLPPLPGDDRGGGRCIKPWEMCQIDVDGSVRFCYKSWRQRLGKFDEGFDLIWRGEHYRKLRATIDAKETYFPYCKHCSMRNGVNHECAHDQRLHADAYVIPGLEELQTAFNERDRENRMAFADRKRRVK